MWRGLVAVAAVASAASAQPVTRPSQVAVATDPRPAAAKPAHHRAGKRRATHPKKKHEASRLAATKRVVKKLAAPGRITVEEQSAALAAIGRVRYAANMPPGFVWPATPDMMTVERGCEAELAAQGIAWQRADAVGKIADPIVAPALTFGGIRFHSAFDQGPFVMDCQLARMLARVGPSLWQLGVRDVAFGSIYRNTLVRFGGVTGKALSRHALGLAMDIVSFTDRDGRVVKVETDYPRHDPLLLAIEDLIDHDKDFRILLTPKNDPISHHDHFHLEASVDFRPAE